MNTIQTAPLQHCVFIVRGNFNPPIFQPDWFSRHSLLPLEEIEGLLSEPSKKEIPELGITLLSGQQFIVGSEQTVIHFSSLRFTATRDRLEVRCEKREGFALILSLLKKLFKILPETPIVAYGINFEEHLRFKRTPEEIIGQFFSKGKNVSQVFGENARCGYTIQTDKVEAKVNFIFQPSPKIDNGIYLKVNFHYEGQDFDGNTVVSNIDQNFSESLEFTETIIYQYFGEII
jgi:hypothetical protein